MENTKIEWCNTIGPDGKSYPGMTFNPWWGCQKVSPACTNCYAATFANRYHPGLWGPAKTTPRKIASEEYWKQPIKWNYKAEKLGLKLKVFCASMSDVFEDHPGVIEARLRLFNLIELTPNLNWLLLTKRPENIIRMVPDQWKVDFLPDNVWVGTTVENQKYADERIPHLLKVRARVRFLSMEPLSGPVDLTSGFVSPDGSSWYNGVLKRKYIDWVIAGGESGHAATPSHPDWFRSLRDQCKAAGVPFFFKQWGEFRPYITKFPGKLYEPISLDHMGKISLYWSGEDWRPITKNLPVSIAMKNCVAARVGKLYAGRLLDYIEHNDMPL